MAGIHAGIVRVVVSAAAVLAATALIPEASAAGVAVIETRHSFRNNDLLGSPNLDRVLNGGDNHQVFLDEIGSTANRLHIRRLPNRQVRFTDADVVFVEHGLGGMPNCLPDAGKAICDDIDGLQVHTQQGNDQITIEHYNYPFLVAAGEGNDRIVFSATSSGNVDCGPGLDTLTAYAHRPLSHVNCETVVLN